MSAFRAIAERWRLEDPAVKAAYRQRAEARKNQKDMASKPRIYAKQGRGSEMSERYLSEPQLDSPESQPRNLSSRLIHVNQSGWNMDSKRASNEALQVAQVSKHKAEPATLSGDSHLVHDLIADEGPAGLLDVEVGQIWGSEILNFAEPHGLECVKRQPLFDTASIQIGGVAVSTMEVERGYDTPIVDLMNIETALAIKPPFPSLSSAVEQ